MGRILHTHDKLRDQTDSNFVTKKIKSVGAVVLVSCAYHILSHHLFRRFGRLYLFHAPIIYFIISLDGSGGCTGFMRLSNTCLMRLLYPCFMHLSCFYHILSYQLLGPPPQKSEKRGVVCNIGKSCGGV